MPTWSEFAAASPELADAVRRRIESHLHHVMGTLRADGSPRLSGTEVRLFDGDVWLGCMPRSRKAADLRRDPRVAIHTAPTDPEVADGDAKLAGSATEVTDIARLASFLSSLGHLAEGEELDPADATAFTVDLASVSLTKVVVDHMEITTWRADGDTNTVEVR